MSRGTVETQKLISNLEEQLNRLVIQLSDLEECKSDLDESEYNESKQETLDQLKEFRESLEKMTEGNISLVNEVNSIQLAIQAAISEAFRTPEVIRMFAKRQPGQLRERLNEIKRNAQMGKLNNAVANEQIVEILVALRKLGDELSSDELDFLQANSSVKLTEFDRVSSNIGGKQALDAAGSQVKYHLSK